MKKIKITFVLCLSILSISFKNIDPSKILGNYLTADYNVIIEKIDYEKNGFSINIEYPHIQNFEHSYFQFALNHAFSEAVKTKVEEYEKIHKERIDENEYEGEVFTEINIRTEILRKGNILSIRMNEMNYEGGAHLSHEFHSVNIDMKGMKILDITDVFNINEEYETGFEELKALINSALLAKDPSACNLITYNEMNNFKNFNLLTNGVSFMLNRLGGHACGESEVIVSYQSLKAQGLLKINNY